MAEIPEDIGEGKQIQLLRVTLRKAIEEIVDGYPDEELLKLLSVSSLKKRKLVQLLEIFKRKIVRTVLEEVEIMFKNEDLDKLLRQREEIIQQQKDFEGLVTWRPAGSVTEDIRAHDMSIYKAKIKQLTVMCEREEKEVDELFVKVSEARGRILNCERNLHKAWENFHEIKDFVQTQREALNKLADSVVID